jgi:hypothetical protein
MCIIYFLPWLLPVMWLTSLPVTWLPVISLPVTSLPVAPHCSLSNNNLSVPIYYSCGAFWPEVTESREWKRPCPEVSLTGSMLCACPDFSRVFFLVVEQDVTKGHLTPSEFPWVCATYYFTPLFIMKFGTFLTFECLTIHFNLILINIKCVNLNRRHYWLKQHIHKQIIFHQHYE